MSRPLAVHEEHGEVVGTWRALGYHGETVVCFDRHLDLKPLAADAVRRIGDARDIEALRGLNRPLPLREAPGAFGLDDFFAAGPVLGAVHALWWVMPGRWPDGRARVRAAVDAVARLPVEPQALADTRVVDGVLHTRVCGLELQVHTLETLQARGVPHTARVDVDLDWLADGDAPPQHTARELVGLLNALGCRERLDSLTWSVRSGFSSATMRGTASELAEAVGRPLERVPWDTAWPMPERTFAALRGPAPHERRAERAELRAELEPLGALGVALGGCLAVREGQLEQAEDAWQRAAEAGVRSSWLAHGIGVAWHARDPGRALAWLERAIGTGIDTLEVHAATLAVMSLLRLGRADEARARVGALVERHPLHRKLVRTGVLIATDPDERARLLARDHAIEALVATGGA
jgi:hypothetical protein